jgi:hypothetical protein
MKYLLMIYGNEAMGEAASKADMDQMHSAYGAYTAALNKAGVMIGGERLRPSGAATTVRNQDGKAKVLNGPYSDTREQLGGYFMIVTPDLDAAIAWAARCPGASIGAIELRPIAPM